jgi:hypothetical protein
MANNRGFLEVIKRLLSAETYFRSREDAKAREAECPAPPEKPNTPPS